MTQPSRFSRWRPSRLAAGPVLALSLAACAQAPAGIPSHRISGQLNALHDQVTVFIDGEEVISGPLRLPECGGPGPLGFCGPYPWPLEGEYRGQPLRVECGRVPPAATPYCTVELGGQVAKQLVFSEVGPDGAPAAR